MKLRDNHKQAAMETEEKGRKAKGGKKRLYIQVGDLRICPEIISAYFPVDDSNAVRIFLPNGHYLEVGCTEQERERLLELFDSLSKPVRV